MPGRSHQAKRGLAAQRRARCFNRAAGRVPRVHLDLRIKRRIEIEIFPRIGNAFDMVTRVYAQQLNYPLPRVAAATPTQGADPLTMARCERYAPVVPDGPQSNTPGNEHREK